MIITSSYWRDANSVPITTDGLVTTDTQVLSANNTTAAVPLFTVTGNIECRGLWGIVTTTLSSAITVAFWRLNDQTATTALTVATGSTLSGIVAGSQISKIGLVATAMRSENATANHVNEVTSNLNVLSPFLITAKAGALNQIEFVYTTTNAPATGAIQFFLRWLPLSLDANVVPV